MKNISIKTAKCVIEDRQYRLQERRSGLAESWSTDKAVKGHSQVKWEQTTRLGDSLNKLGAVTGDDRGQIVRELLLYDHN